MNWVQHIQTAAFALIGLIIFLGHGYLAFALLQRMRLRGPRAILGVAWAILFFYALTVSFHVLAALGYFRREAAFVWSLFLVGVAHAVLPKEQRYVGREWLGLGGFVKWRSLGASARVVVGVAVGCASITLAKTLLVPPLGWDAVSYHAAKAGMWVQTGSLQTLRGPGGWSYFPLFPGGGDLVYAWAALPFRSDLVMCAAGGAIWVGCTLATYALARLGGTTRLSSAAASLLVAFTPAMHRITGSCYVEPILTFYTALTACSCIWFLKCGELGWLLLTFMGAGLMMGVKVMGLVLGSVAVAWTVAAAVSRTKQARRAWNAIGLGILLLALAVAPWWAQSVAVTGRPLSPIPLKILGIELGRILPDLAWIQHRPGTVLSVIDEWQGFLTLLQPSETTPRLGPIWSVLFAAWLPAVAILVAKERRSYALCMASFVLAFLVAFYHPEMLVLRKYWATTNSRYWIQILPLVAAVVAAGAETVLRRRTFWLLFAFAATAFYAAQELCWGVSGVTLRALPATASMVGATLLLSIAIAARYGIRNLVLVALLIICGGAPALQAYRDRTRWAVYGDEHTKMFHSLLRYWVSAASTLDMPPSSYRIAVASGPWQNGDNWLVYPFLGRRYQNQLLYVPITASGRIPSFDGTDSYVAEADFAAWVARLYQWKITHVMSFWPPSLEFMWMQEYPELFEPISVDSRWGGCYRLRPWPIAKQALDKRALEESGASN